MTRSNGTAPLEAESHQSGDGAASPARMLAILDIFTQDEPVWSTADIIEALEVSRSTGYRYIKTLNDFGLLTTVANGQYSLGPKIIEMDLQIRMTDPLLTASRGVLEELVDKMGHSAILCTAFRDSVLCIAESRAPDSPVNRFSRGQRRPLFMGSSSKVILAYMPHYRLKSIFANQQDEIASAGLGDSWSEFRATLGKIKRDGSLLTVGEFNPGVAAVAAPVLTREKVSIGSVSVAWDEKDRPDVNVDLATKAVKNAASIISSRLPSPAENENTHERTAPDSGW